MNPSRTASLSSTPVALPPTPSIARIVDRRRPLPEVPAGYETKHDHEAHVLSQMAATSPHEEHRLMAAEVMLAAHEGRSSDLESHGDALRTSLTEANPVMVARADRSASASFQQNTFAKYGFGRLKAAAIAVAFGAVLASGASSQAQAAETHNDQPAAEVQDQDIAAKQAARTMLSKKFSAMKTEELDAFAQEGVSGRSRRTNLLEIS